METVIYNIYKMTAKQTIVLSLLILTLMSGCVSRYQMDMVKQRQANLKDDLACLVPATPVSLPDPLTLDDVVRIGLQNNLDMRISRIMAEIADDNALAERMRILPQLNLQGDLSYRSDYDLKEYENLDTGERTLGRSISEEKLRKSVNLSLSWNVLDFGLSFIRARQAAMKNQVQRMERLRQAQKLASEIASAYWKAVLAEHELEYIAGIETEAKKYKEKAAKMAAQKRIDPISVKTIEKKIADLAITTANLQADVSGARIDLCRLMGLNPMTQFTLAKEDFQAYVEKIPDSEAISPEKMEMISLNHRPEFFAADIQARVQQDEARAALVSMFPGIRFDIANYYDDNKYLVNNYWSSVGLSVVANFLSLPSKYANLKAQEKTEALVKAQRLMLTAGVIAHTHIALHDFRVKEKRLRLHDDAYAISEELLSMCRQRHELGALSDTVMTEQMMENMVTRLQRNRCMIDLINAYHMLLTTMGLDYSQWRENIADMNENVMPADIEARDIQ